MYRLSDPLFRKMIFASLALALFTHPVFSQPVPKEKACEIAAAQLEEGDFIFLDIKSLVFKHIADLTNSWTSHVGIALKDEEGQWVVYESTTPRAKISSLCSYLERTDGGNRFAIRRLNRALSKNDLSDIKAYLTERLGIRYDYGFNFNSEKMFCSKLAYLAFKEVLDLEIGKKQSFEDLKEENPDADLRYVKIWFGGRIPWHRVTVTPHSQYIDNDMETVFESL